MLTQSQGAFLRGRRWLSETLTAWVQSESFRSKQDAHSKRLSKELTIELSHYVPKATSKGRLSARIRSDIVDPAMRLHTDIKCSRYVYSFRKPHNLNTQELEKDANNWTLKSMTTWRTIESHQEALPSSCLFPGLYRDQENKTDSRPPLTLVKPVILVSTNANPIEVSPQILRVASWPAIMTDTQADATQQVRERYTWPGATNLVTVDDHGVFSESEGNDVSESGASDESNDSEEGRKLNSLARASHLLIFLEDYGVAVSHPGPVISSPVEAVNLSYSNR
jgi:hypothetical protein